MTPDLSGRASGTSYWPIGRLAPLGSHALLRLPSWGDRLLLPLAPAPFVDGRAIAANGDDIVVTAVYHVLRALVAQAQMNSALDPKKRVTFTATPLVLHSSPPLCEPKVPDAYDYL